MNGKVLTSKIKGCPTDMDLCDVQVLLDRVNPFATTNCDYTPSKPESDLTWTVDSIVERDTPIADTNGNYTAMIPESEEETTKNSSFVGDTRFATKNRHGAAINNSVDGVVLQLSAMLMIVILGRLAMYMYVVMRR